MWPLSSMDNAIYDLAIVGAGVNGCGIARDATDRGLRVLLCEKADLGAATSSASSKLIDECRAMRLVHHYGTDGWRILDGSRKPGDLGRPFGGDLTEAEVEHLLTYEFVRRAEDIVWRRTKSGLRMAAAEVAAIDDWMGRRSGA